MNHIEYLVGLLRPLKVYDLSAGTRNRAELDAYANQLNDGCDQIEETAREMSLTTAESFGLERVEELVKACLTFNREYGVYSLLGFSYGSDYEDSAQKALYLYAGDFGPEKEIWFSDDEMNQKQVEACSATSIFRKRQKMISSR